MKNYSNSRYLKWACDLETSSEYHIDNKPSAKEETKEYREWDKKRLNCKAWIYLYCACESNRYVLDIEFEPWIKKIIKRTKERVKTTKLNLFFHNLKYDGSFLLYELYKIGYKFVHQNELKRNEKLVSALIDKTKKIYSIKFFYENYFFKVQCSYNLIRCGISDILTFTKKKEVVIDYLPNIKYSSLEEVPKNVIDYIKQDCYAITIIWKIIREIKNNSFHTKNRLSVGSWAKDCAYWAFNTSKFKKENLRLIKKSHWKLDSEKDLELFKYLRTSYYGGLTGLNKNFLVNGMIDVRGNIGTYDINSAYPAIMLNDVPYMKPLDRRKKNDNPYLIRVTITKISNIRVLQSYWLIHHFFDKKRNSFLIWSFEWENIKKLMDLKYNVIKKYYFLFVPFYRDFVEVMSQLKEKYSIELKNAENKEKSVYYAMLRKTVKLLLNSPYGKEAQKEYKNIEIDENYQWNETESKNDKVRFTNIAAASFITAQTRNMILEVLIKFPNNILYWDTDSLHVLFDDNLDIQTFENSLNIDDFKLGAWKYEEEVKHARYLKRKCYALLKEDGTDVVKTAGYNFSEGKFEWSKFFKGEEFKDISLFSFRNKWQQIILAKINKKL